MPHVYTAVAGIDCMTTVIFCTYIFFVDNDAILFLKIVNFIGIAGCILLYLIVTESPRWLILNNRNE